jgi:hypothetical protein
VRPACSTVAGSRCDTSAATMQGALVGVAAPMACFGGVGP